MRYLLRIDPASREEGLLLEAADARNVLILNVVNEVLSLPEATLDVYTTNELVRREMQEQGLSVLFDPVEFGDDRSPQDRVVRALRVFLEHGRGSGEGPVVVIDYRNAHMGAQALERLQEACAADPGSCFSSFAPACDHPALLRARFCLSGPEYLVFPDNITQGAPLIHWRSRPFFFDWRALGVWEEKPGFYVLSMEENGSALNLAPLASLGENIRNFGPEVAIFFWESPCLARRVLATPPDLDAPGTAVAAYAPFSKISVCIEMAETRGRLRWSADCEGGVLRLWPMRGKSIGERVEIRLSRGAGSGRGEFDFDPEADGLLACLLEPAEGDVYDCTLPLDGTGLWTFSSELERPRDLKTNRTICNRQELPEVWEQDWSLLAGWPEALLAGVEQGCPWRVIDLSPREAIKVSSATHLAVETGVRLAPELFARGMQEFRSEDKIGAKFAGHLSAASVRSETAAPPFWAGRGAAEFLAERRAVSRRTFTWRQLRWLTEWPLEDENADSFLLWIIHEFVARKLDEESKKLSEDEILLLLPRDVPRNADRGRDLDILDLPRIAFSSRLWALGSDGMSRIFACVQREGQPGLLLASYLVEGGFHRFGRENVNYRSLWFDRDERLLYAFFLDGRGLAKGIDVFDCSLRLLHMAALPAALRGRGRLNHLSGNASSLFLMDYDLRLMCEFDKRTFIFRDFHCFSGRELVQCYVCHGQEVFACSPYDSLVSIIYLRGERGQHIQNMCTLYPTMLDYDTNAGNFYVVNRETFPRDLEACAHWLHCLGRDGACKRSYFLGERLIWRIHVMQDAGVVLLADYDGNLSAFRCEGAEGATFPF